MADRLGLGCERKKETYPGELGAGEELSPDMSSQGDSFSSKWR